MLDGPLPKVGSLTPPKKPFSVQRYAFASAAPLLAIGPCVLPLVFSGPAHAPAAPAPALADAPAFSIDSSIAPPVAPVAVAAAEPAAPAPVALAAASITKAAPSKKLAAAKKASKKKSPAKKSTKKTNVARR